MMYSTVLLRLKLKKCKGGHVDMEIKGRTWSHHHLFHQNIKDDSEGKKKVKQILCKLTKSGSPSFCLHCRFHSVSAWQKFRAKSVQFSHIDSTVLSNNINSLQHMVSVILLLKRTQRLWTIFTFTLSHLHLVSNVFFEILLHAYLFS